MFEAIRDFLAALQLLSPLFMTLLQAYQDGKLDAIEKQIQDAKTPEEKRAARIAFAQRFYDK